MVTHIYITIVYMDQPGKVANPVRGQLNRGNYHFPLSAFAPENLVSRDRFGSSITRQPAHLNTQTESGVYLQDFLRSSAASSINLFKPPYAIGPRICVPMAFTAESPPAQDQ